jgi:hypothetical protein
VTPITELLPEVVRGLERMIRQSKGAIEEVLRNLSDKVGSSFEKILASEAKLKFGVQLPVGVSAEVELAGSKETLSISPARIVRAALEALRNALEQAGNDSTFVIIIDEIGDGLTWGDDVAASAAWRSALEATDLRRIRWLVASTRPMRQEMQYSPVSNVFREETVGYLSGQETDACIDAFGSYGPAREGKEKSAPESEGQRELSQNERKAEEKQKEWKKLAPVVTPLGRVALTRWTGRLPFLLQVACSYVFDRATVREVPIITSDLVRRTLVDRVAMELSDYFEAQWAELGKDPTIRKEILDSLVEKYGHAENVWNKALSEPSHIPERRRGDGRARNAENKTDPKSSIDSRVTLGPATRRALSRSGLEGASGEVAPLAAYWLLSTVPAKTPTTSRGARDKTSLDA